LVKDTVQRGKMRPKASAACKHLIFYGDYCDKDQRADVQVVHITNSHIEPKNVRIQDESLFDHDARFRSHGLSAAHLQSGAGPCMPAGAPGKPQ